MTPPSRYYLTSTRQLGSLPHGTSQMSPGAYLEFAIEDLSAGTARGVINAFGTAKRAFHLVIDSLLNQYGLFAKVLQGELS